MEQLFLTVLNMSVTACCIVPAVLLIRLLLRRSPKIDSSLPMGRDMEMSCDERVLGQLGVGIRADYSRSLLSVATRQFGPGIPLAFGESNVKARVKNALRYSRPARWAAAGAGLLCLLTVVACTADPQSEPAFDAELAKKWASTFTTEETDRAKIGALAYSRYREAFMAEDVPDEYRIESYSVTEAKLYSESETEFAVAITGDYACRSTYWLSANGRFVPRADGSGYDCTGDECFVYLRALGDGRYELYDINTGGNFPGEPVSSAPDLDSESEDSVSDGTFTYDLTNLDQAIDWATLQHAGGDYYTGEFPVTAHRIFDTAVDGETVTAYIQFVYAEMDFKNSIFTEASGGAGPARLMFHKNPSGGYRCEEYKKALIDPRELFSEKAYAAYLDQDGIDDLREIMRDRCRVYLKSIGQDDAVVKLGGETQPDADFYLWPLENKVGEVTGSLTLYEGHTGVDILAPRETAVLAVAAGRVTAAQKTPAVDGYRGYGRYVFIEHADGRITRYAHLDSVLVAEGQEVAAGTPIGTVGDSGDATTTHLHFELWRAGAPLDPLDYLTRNIGLH